MAPNRGASPSTLNARSASGCCSTPALAGELVANVEPLPRFADLLEGHIRTEEREIFPGVSKPCSGWTSQRSRG